MNVKRLQLALAHIRRLPEVAACLGSMEHAPGVVASYVGLRPLRLPSVARFRNGVEYRLQQFYDLETLWQIHFHGVYPLRPSDRVIIDAGANIGLFACWAASRNPQATIYAVEPEPSSFARLVEHVRANGFEGRVIPFQSALSSSQSLAWLAASPIASQMVQVRQDGDGEGIAIKPMSLKDLLDRIPDEHIDFLKMDIEGSEYDVLLSSRPEDLRRVRRMSIEYHLPPAGSGFTKTALVDHLRACGFAISDPDQADYGMLHAWR